MQELVRQNKKCADISMPEFLITTSNLNKEELSYFVSLYVHPNINAVFGLMMINLKLHFVIMLLVGTSVEDNSTDLEYDFTIFHGFEHQSFKPVRKIILSV